MQSLCDPKTVQDLRHLTDVTEWVRDVSDRHCGSIISANLSADQQIADDGFRADEELIRKHLPWTDMQTAGLYKPANGFKRVRADLAVIFKQDRLAIQHKIGELNISAQNS